MTDTDEFLAHYGVPGMKWGKRNAESRERVANEKKSSKEKKPGMSREKKVAIALGIGAVAAIGAAVAVKSMNKNLDLPISSMLNSPAVSIGQSMVENRMSQPSPSLTLRPPAPKRPSASLDLGRPAGAGRPTPAPTRPTAPRSNPGPTSLGSTSLGDLSSIINGGPQVTWDSKTGQYVTR